MRLFRFSARLIGLVAALGIGQSVQAQTHRWDDGGSGANRNWDNAANWFDITNLLNDVAPPNTADVQFGTGYSTAIAVNLNGNRTVNSLAFGVPAQTTLTGNTLTVNSGLITVYGNQFVGTNSSLPPNGSVVTAASIIDSNLSLGVPGVFDVQGSAELRTNGVISVVGGGGVTRTGSGVWSIGGTANTLSSLTLQTNSGSVATTRFGDVGNAAAGSIGVNAAGIANRINWGRQHRLLFNGSAPNQVLSKDIALVFDPIATGIYSFETFNASGAVGPNAGSITLAGIISGDLTNGGTEPSNSFNFNATSPTDPNFAAVLSGNNTFRANVTVQGGILRLTHNNALGNALSAVPLGSGATGSGARTDAALLVNAGRTIAQNIESFAPSGTTDTIVYTVGGASDFIAGTSMFSGGINFNTGSQSKGLTLVAHGSSVVVFSGPMIGNTGTGTGPGSKLIKNGTGTVRLTASSSFTGAVEIRSGTLQLQGNGQMTGITGLVSVFTGGTIELNNTAGVVTNRIATNRAIELSGGTLSLISGNTTLGALTVRPGAGSIVIDPNGSTSTMTLTSLTRPVAGPLMGGMIDFRAAGAGVLGGTARAVFNTAPTQTNGIIGGWATANGGSDWATYDGLNGVTALSVYTSFASAGATSNALVGNGATTDAIGTINSLKIATTVAGGSLNTGGTLTVGTGGVLHTGGQTYTIANALSSTTDLAVTTGGTLTLGGATTAAGLSKAGAGTLVLNAPFTFTGTNAAMNVNAGSLTFQGDNRVLGDNRIVNLNSTAAIGIDLNNTNQTLGGLSGVGSVSIGSGTLTIRAPDIGPDSILSGTISGSGVIVKTGLRAQILAGDNPFTGSITVNRGALRLTGVNQATGPIELKQVGDSPVAGLTLSGRGTLAAASTQPITIGPAGSLSISNGDSPMVALSNRADRVSDTRPISLSAGTIGFTGAPLPYVSASETLGPLTIGPGAATIRSSLAETGGPAALTFTQFVSRAIGSTVNFQNAFGDGTIGGPGGHPRVFFSSGMPSGVIPWATVTTRPSITTFATFFAAYNTTGAVANANGIQLLDPAAQIPFATAGAGDNAILTNSGSLAANKTVSTLNIDTTANGHSLALGSNNLVIASGGLLKTGNQDYSITGTGTLGSAGGELFVHVFATSTATQPVLTVGVPIAANGVTKAGPGILNLTVNNTYTGTTMIGGGSLQVMNPIASATDSATGDGPVIVSAGPAPGSLLIGGNSAGTAGQITGPVFVGGILAAGTNAGPGILTIRNDVTFSPDGTGMYSALLGGNALGTEHSRLRVIDGDVVLNGARFNPIFSGTPTAAMTIFEVTNGTITGQFTMNGVTLGDGAIFANFNGTAWFIDYTPTTIVIAPVPEPASVLAICAGGVSLAGAIRRARRPGRPPVAGV